MAQTVYIWIINDNGDILLQRRCATKDSNPNMLDISSAGHLTAGDESLFGAIRELKEELNNEFVDLYILRTTKSIDEMKYQEEEISEILFVPYKKFKEMVKNEHPELLRHDEEFEILFNIFDKEFDN